MKALALVLLAALLFASCSADNTTTTDTTETTTETTTEPQESDDQTQKRSALAGSADYAQDLGDFSQQRQYPYPGNTGPQGSYGGNYNNPNYGNYGNDHGYENVIPGTAVRDYPIYAHPPITRFSCKGLPAGLYADLESRCQAWHICQEDGRHDRFLCANGTLFNQKFLVCDWWYNVQCERSGQYVGGSPYPPYQPKPIYPTNIYNPLIPKKPEPQQPYYPPIPEPQQPYYPPIPVPKPTQKPYYPTQQPPQGPQLPYYPPQVPQQPFPPLVPQQPYPPQVPQQPYLPQGPRPSYPQGPHITFPGPYIPGGNEGNYNPADIGIGAINRNSGKINENFPQTFPLYKAAPSTKTISTADFPTNRKIADKDNNQEDFEPVQY